MGYPGGQQSECIELFGFNLLFRFFARASDISDQHDVSKVSLAFFSDRGEVKIQVSVFGIKNLKIPAHRPAVGVHQVGPIDAADDLVQGFALGLLGCGAKKPTPGMIDETDSPRGVEEENAFLKRFEDLLKEAFFAN